jgi:hypothetical protein
MTNFFQQYKNLFLEEPAYERSKHNERVKL